MELPDTLNVSAPALAVMLPVPTVPPVILITELAAPPVIPPLTVPLVISMRSPEIKLALPVIRPLTEPPSIK